MIDTSTRRPNLDEKQKRVIENIEPYTLGMDLICTRGHSTPGEQLDTIEKLAANNKVHFPEFQSGNLEEIIDIPDVGKGYRWQRTHSHLLNIGVIVNPPLECTILEDYIRPNGENMKGETMQPSPHITSDPIDFSSRVNGVPHLDLVVSIMTRAKAAGAGIRYIKPEPKNGCVHVDIA